MSVQNDSSPSSRQPNEPLASLVDNAAVASAFKRIDALASIGPSSDSTEASSGYDDFQYNDGGHDDTSYDR